MVHIDTDNPLIQLKLWWYEFLWENRWAILALTIICLLGCFLVVKKKKNKF